MATSVNFSRFFAALAAVLTLALTACGGGGESTSQEARDMAARQAFTGKAEADPTASNTPKSMKQALAAPVVDTASAMGFQLVVSTGNPSKAAPETPVSIAAVTPSITPDELMNWAETVFNKNPENYFPSHQATGSITLDGDGDGQLETIAYRYYPETGNYVGVQTAGKDVGGVYLYGTYVANVLTRYAYIDQFRCLVKPDLCRPKVTGVTPAEGATGVEIKNVPITVKFDRPLICPAGPITGTFGSIAGTLTCTNAVSTAEVIIVATTLPDNSRITATLTGFRSAEGAVEMAAHTWSFTTRKGIVTVLETKVLTANLSGVIDREAVSVIDAVTNGVDKKVMLPQVPGYLRPTWIHVDSTRSVAYVGMWSGFVLYRFNASTGQVLPPFFIEDQIYWNERVHGINGLAGSGNEVCVVTGAWGAQSEYTHRNRLICFNADTSARTFVSATDFLGTVAEIPTNLFYHASRQKYYVLMATEGCLFLETEGAGGRDGYCAGSTGRLVEINAVTKAKERSWSVGSMPLAMKPVGDKMYVLKSGDRGLTIVNLASGATQSVDWSAVFGKFAYPVDLECDEAVGACYVSDWLNSIRVMSLATNQQVAAIALPGGRVPRGVTMASGDLWVTAPLRDTFHTDAQTVYRINLSTRQVKQTIPLGTSLQNGVGLLPWDIAVYERKEVQ